MKMPVQLVEIELVCWPANSTAMSRPVISSSVSERPPSTFWYLAAHEHASTDDGVCAIA
jgi:hypothetical protein